VKKNSHFSRIIQTAKDKFRDKKLCFFLNLLSILEIGTDAQKWKKRTAKSTENQIMEEALNSLLHRSKNELDKAARKKAKIENAKLPKKPRIEKRPTAGGIQLHLFQSGYQLVRGDSKQSSSLIPYSNKDILDEVAAGRIPLSIASWLESDKLFLKNGQLEIAVIERGSSGKILSSETITLHHENTALESAQILSETSQIYRWSDKDRLILDSCLSLATSAPLCLSPSPLVHLIQNRARSNPYQPARPRGRPFVPPIDRASAHPGVKTNHDRQKAASPKQPLRPLPEVPVPELLVKIVPPVAPGRREIQIKSKNSRSSQLVTIEIERIQEGYQGKAVCQQLATTTGLLASDSKTSLQFTAESPREVELLAQQYVMLFCNNVPQNSTITVIDGDSREDHESPASFPFPLFLSLWENKWEPVPSKFSARERRSSDSSAIIDDFLDDLT